MVSRLVLCSLLALGALGACSSAEESAPPASTTATTSTVLAVTDSEPCAELATSNGRELISGREAPTEDVALALSYAGPFKADLADIFAFAEPDDRSSLCVLSGYPKEWGDTSGYAQLDGMATLYVIHAGRSFVMLTDVADNLNIALSSETERAS